MSHDMQVVFQDGTSRNSLPCDDVKEEDNGISVYDLSDGREKIGYIPYEKLLFVLPNE